MGTRKTELEMAQIVDSQLSMPFARAEKVVRRLQAAGLTVEHIGVTDWKTVSQPSIGASTEQSRTVRVQFVKNDGTWDFDFIEWVERRGGTVVGWNQQGARTQNRVFPARIESEALTEKPAISTRQALGMNIPTTTRFSEDWMINWR